MSLLQPRNLAYAYRVGSCGFGTMAELIMALTKSGLGALELFAMGMKATGTMVSRALSYSGEDWPQRSFWAEDCSMLGICSI